MMENESLPRVERVQSTTPVSNLEAFDMMSRYLAAEKAQQLSLDFAGQTYLASSSQAWNDMRLSCNSLLEENDPRREPVAAWKDESVFEQAEATPPSPPEQSMATTPATEKISKEARRSEKKEKKEAKKVKKEARRASKAHEKADKKARKESKKRKHEED
jgi:hypothetical protein